MDGLFSPFFHLKYTKDSKTLLYNSDDNQLIIKSVTKGYFESSPAIKIVIDKI